MSVAEARKRVEQAAGDFPWTTFDEELDLLELETKAEMPCSNHWAYEDGFYEEVAGANVCAEWNEWVNRQWTPNDDPTERPLCPSCSARAELAAMKLAEAMPDVIQAARATLHLSGPA